MAAVSRWFLRWLSDQDSGLDESDQREWERRNVFLIPAALKNSRAQSPRRIASQHHGGRVPSHRPAIRPQPAGVHGSYGRFGKSCPPGLEPPIERQDEEQAEQGEGTGGCLKRVHSGMSANIVPKRRSMERSQRRSISLDDPDERQPHPVRAGLRREHVANASLDTTASDGSNAALRHPTAMQQNQLMFMPRWQPVDGVYLDGNACFEAMPRVNGTSKAGFAAEVSNSESDSMMNDLQLQNLQLPAPRDSPSVESISLHSSACSATLDELLDESVRELSGLSLMHRAAPMLTMGRRATVDALNESLSNACLHAMLVDEQPKQGQPASNSKPCSSAVHTRRDTVPTMRRAISWASHV